jgi:hypothetical protein
MAACDDGWPRRRLNDDDANNNNAVLIVFFFSVKMATILITKAAVQYNQSKEIEMREVQSRIHDHSTTRKHTHI